jgi:hypothetical protein
MGLLVKVYQNIKEASDKEDYCFDAYVISEEWNYKIKNLKNRGLYDGDCVFKGISYPCTSHNRFREQLVKLIDRMDLIKPDGTIDWDNLKPDMPFYDFIDFADNEGCLDFEVSEKIYQSFKEWEVKAQFLLTGWVLDKYNEWLQAFDLSRQNGVMVFS